MEQQTEPLRNKKKKVIPKPLAVDPSLISRPEGRPIVFTPEVIQKLEQVFAMDGTVKEACLYAGISPSTYYDWVKDLPELSERFEALREKPVLKARETVINSLKTPDGARWYLERKRRKEFGVRPEEEADKAPQGNIYNFFFSPELQTEVRSMEDRIKEALIQPKNV